ncbi:MAG: YqgE/AlgH family protein [Myxococcales bacterium]|nr:YqgE/AlgH family protein [Myxococcales bacterium]MCB9708311.1 YqgE/AlgH family protein [Myxococcales bacterium]
MSSLSPGFLVASASMTDPHFKRAVVLLIEHQSQGSFGFLINRPAGISFQGVAEELGLETSPGEVPDLPVLTGGPIAPHTGWIVFDPKGVELPEDGAVSVSHGLSVSASRDLLQTIAKGQGPARRLLALGYAGWDAGQLDEELKRGTWIPVDLEEAIVFDTPYEQRWSASLDKLGIDPARLVSHSLPEA